jgi:hypothetical protein
MEASVPKKQPQPPQQPPQPPKNNVEARIQEIATHAHQQRQLQQQQKQLPQQSKEISRDAKFSSVIDSLFSSNQPSNQSLNQPSNQSFNQSSNQSSNQVSNQQQTKKIEKSSDISLNHTFDDYLNSLIPKTEIVRDKLNESQTTSSIRNLEQERKTTDLNKEQLKTTEKVEKVSVDQSINMVKFLEMQRKEFEASKPAPTGGIPTQVPFKQVQIKKDSSGIDSRLDDLLNSRRNTDF